MLFKSKKILLTGLLAGILVGGSYTAVAEETTSEIIEILAEGAGIDKESAMNNAHSIVNKTFLSFIFNGLFSC